MMNDQEVFMKKLAAKHHPDIQHIRAVYDPIKDWRMDPAGYFLIRINPETDELEAGLCRKDNTIEKKVNGKTAEEMYNTVLKHVTLLPEHAAYLGKELMKAQIARELGLPYIQDDPLELGVLKSK